MKISRTVMLSVLPLILQIQLGNAAPKDVNVVNTDNNPVPIVSVGDLGVNVTNTTPIPVTIVNDYVSLRMSGTFTANSCCLTDPDTTFIPRLEIDQFGGRSLLIEYVSCQVMIQSDQQVNLYIGKNGQNAPVDALVPIVLTEQARALASDSFSGNTLHASQPVQVIVGPEDALLLNGRRTPDALGRASCVIAGRLVD